MRGSREGHLVLEIHLAQLLQPTTKDYMGPASRSLESGAPAEGAAQARRLSARARLVLVFEGGNASSKAGGGSVQDDRGAAALHAVVHALSRPAAAAALKHQMAMRSAATPAEFAAATKAAAAAEGASKATGSGAGGAASLPPYGASSLTLLLQACICPACPSPTKS